MKAIVPIVGECEESMASKMEKQPLDVCIQESVLISLREIHDRECGRL
jgi:hypothetical protein